MPSAAAYLDGLRRELENARRSGRDGYVAAVEAEIARVEVKFGYRKVDEAPPVVERAVPERHDVETPGAGRPASTPRRPQGRRTGTRR